MDSVLPDTWWRFDRYELAMLDSNSLSSLVIRPASGVDMQSYSVSERHQALGPSRAPYLELARLGAHLRDWYLRHPFGPYNADGSLLSHSAFADMVKQIGKSTPGAMGDLTRAWLTEVTLQGLHTPVLEWCRRFGLLGVPDIDSGSILADMRRSPSAGPIRSRLEDISTLTRTPAFWKTYEEPFVSFAGSAVQMAWVLRGVEHPELKRRSRSLEILNLLLEPVGLIAADDAGHVRPQWKSTSLLGFLAAMALFDLAGGVRIGVCERCGALFSTRRQDKRTCSPRCQEAAKKKRRRDDPEYRARELRRQREARASLNSIERRDHDQTD